MARAKKPDSKILYVTHNDASKAALAVLLERAAEANPGRTPDASSLVRELLIREAQREPVSS